MQPEYEGMALSFPYPLEQFLFPFFETSDPYPWTSTLGLGLCGWEKGGPRGRGDSGISDKDHFFSVPHAFLDSVWVPSVGWAEVAGVAWRKREHTRLTLA